jgi:hypothetical protein
MDIDRVALLVHSLATRPSRRTVVRGLAALVALSLTLNESTVLGKGKGKGKKKTKKKSKKKKSNPPPPAQDDLPPLPPNPCPARQRPCGGKCVADCLDPEMEFDAATCTCRCPSGQVECAVGCVPNCPAGRTMDFDTCTCECPARLAESNGACPGCAAGQVVCDGAPGGCCASDRTCCRNPDSGIARCCPSEAICHPGTGDDEPSCCLPGLVPCHGHCCTDSPLVKCCDKSNGQTHCFAVHVSCPA